LIHELAPASVIYCCRRVIRFPQAPVSGVGRVPDSLRMTGVDPFIRRDLAVRAYYWFESRPLHLVEVWIIAASTGGAFGLWLGG
jgi:hypothetical protein